MCERARVCECVCMCVCWYIWHSPCHMLIKLSRRSRFPSWIVSLLMHDKAVIRHINAQKSYPQYRVISRVSYLHSIGDYYLTLFAFRHPPATELLTSTDGQITWYSIHWFQISVTFSVINSLKTAVYILSFLRFIFLNET